MDHCGIQYFFIILPGLYYNLIVILHVTCLTIGVCSRMMRSCCTMHQCRCALIRIRDLENVKSELNTLLVKIHQYVLSSLELLFSSCFLCCCGGLTSLFFRVASHWLYSAFVSSLNSAKYVHCKGPAMLFSSSSIIKKRRLVKKKKENEIQL